MGKTKELYIEQIAQIWGGQNGEVHLETSDGVVITWSARHLYDDLPHLIAMTHIELEHEQEWQREKWYELGKKLQKDYKK